MPAFIEFTYSNKDGVISFFCTSTSKHDRSCASLSHLFKSVFNLKSINGDSTIINSDNIANGSGGAANSNFAVASSGNVTLTTDNTGSDGIFTVETSVQSDGIGLQDSENLALVTNTGIFKLIGLGQGVFPSSVFTGTLADDGSIWSDASPKTQFYSVDGFLRFYDIDFEHTNNVNKVFGSINKTGLWNGTGGSTLSIQKNVIENQDISWDFTFDTDAKGIRLAAETAVNATPAAKKTENVEDAFDQLFNN